MSIVCHSIRYKLGSGPGGIRTSVLTVSVEAVVFWGPVPISFLSRNDARLSARLRTGTGSAKTRYLFSPDVRFPGQVKGDEQWRRIPWLKARERWTRPHRMD